MAEFIRTSVRQMDPRDGQRFATVYIRLAPGQRRRMTEFVQSTMMEILEECLRQDSYPVCEPLRGFPRTQGRENYTAADIMQDLLVQLQAGKDVAQAQVYRWNKLFEDFADLQINFREAGAPNTYGTLWE